MSFPYLFLYLYCVFKYCIFAGADPGEVKWVNFHPPFSEPPSFFFFLIPQILTLNISTRLWFYYIITKIHPPFQNPGSAPDLTLHSCYWAILQESNVIKSTHSVIIMARLLPPSVWCFKSFCMYLMYL